MTKSKQVVFEIQFVREIKLPGSLEVIRSEKTDFVAAKEDISDADLLTFLETTHPLLGRDILTETCSVAESAVRAVNAWRPVLSRRRIVSLDVAHSYLNGWG